MKRWYGFGAIVFILICYVIVGSLDMKQELREEAWANSVQAIEAEQEKIQLDITEMREQLAKADEQLHSFNLLIWEMRERLHLDLELDLKEESGL